jgi:hypothetical protein
VAGTPMPSGIFLDPKRFLAHVFCHAKQSYQYVYTRSWKHVKLLSSSYNMLIHSHHLFEAHDTIRSGRT